MWLERIACTLAMVGYKMEAFMMAYSGVKQMPKLEDWFPWMPPEAGEAAAKGAPDADLKAAWGEEYERMAQETEGA